LPGINSSRPVELEVEPNLARRLDGLRERNLKDKVSILTLWFTTGGACVLVKVEILEEYFLTYRKASFVPEGDVEYKVLQVSPDGESTDRAIDEDWEQVERMRHFALHYKGRVAQYKRVLTDPQMAKLKKEMAAIYKDMTNDTAK
jgi:hypothetical protein